MAKDTERTNTKPRTKSRELALALAKGIRGGAYPEGRLPGRREIERTFGVSRPTVERALLLLEAEGWLKTAPRRRASVTGAPAGFEAKLAGFLSGSGFAAPLMEGAFRRQDARGRAGVALEDDSVIDLSTLCDEHWDGHLNADLEEEAVSEALDRVRRGESRMFSTSGGQALREAVCKEVARLGIRARPDEVFIISRRLQAYRAISDVLLGPGTDLWYPALSLIPFYGIGERQAAARREIAVTEAGGLELDPFMRSRRRRVLMAEADCAKPLGVSIPEAQRRALVDAARKSGAFIVEDAYCRLMLEAAPLPLAAFDPEHECVIHIGALPVWLTAIGCFNYVIANERIVRLLRSAGRRDYLTPGIFSQLVGERLFSSGRLPLMLSRFHAFHQKRIEETDAVLREAFGERFTWKIPSGFGCIWLDLEGVDLKRLYRCRRGIDFQPGWFYGERPARHALLRYTMPLPVFREGVARLKAAIKAMD